MHTKIHLRLTHFTVSFHHSSCALCHSNKLESVFECPVSRFLDDEGEVEYWIEPVDFTELSATRGATGSVMQGALQFPCLYMISTLT